MRNNFVLSFRMFKVCHLRLHQVTFRMTNPPSRVVIFFVIKRQSKTVLVKGFKTTFASF